MIEVRALEGGVVRDHVSALASVLVDCVEGGASVGFMAPFTLQEAQTYFETVGDEVGRGRRILLAAFDGGALVGTAQVLLAMLPNATHRAEIAKVLVHRAARRRGVARALMTEAERRARDAGKTLLVLDTATGSDAERLYEGLGWARVGTVPDWALYPDGSPCATTIFFKAI